MLVVALIIAGLIALGLGTFLSLNLTSSRLAKRSLHSYAALNLAEAGTEEAVWSINRAVGGDAAAWNGWTQNAGAAWQKFPNFNFSPGTTGYVKVHIDNFNPSAGVQPKIVALASIDPTNEAAVTKMIEVSIRRRSYFASGLVARNSIVFNGTNSSVDSWNSDPDQNAATPPVNYSAAVRIDNGSVAGGSTANTAVRVNQANIWGTVTTGGAQPQVGTLGSIRGANTPPGVQVDPNRVSTDFNADFPVITAPTGGTSIASVGATLGTVGVPTSWRCTSISLSGNQTLTILGDVTLVLTALPGTTGLSVTGNAQIVIPAGSSLSLYTEADVRIGGRGLANNNVQPISFKLWGTGPMTPAQDIQIAGNGDLCGVIYAPNGDVKINGNGNVMGSVIAHDITLVGNAAFHYDESLGVTGPNTPFGIAQWRELNSAADRSVHLPLFSGW